MKKNLIILGIFCFTIFAACEPDRRTAQNEGYPEEETPVSDLEDFEPGLEAVNENAEPEAPAAFIQTAFSGNLMEVELGRMAQEQAASQEVKALGQTLMQDHRAANDKLQAIAQNNNIEVPATTMAAVHQQKVDELRGLSGAEFDRKYLNLILEAHQNAIQRYESMLSKVQDQALKEWISSTLETIRMHQKQIEQLNNSLT